MGPVNWVAVVVAALAAGLLALGWFGPVFGRAKARKVAPGKIAVRRRPEAVAALTGSAICSRGLAPARWRTSHGFIS